MRAGCVNKIFFPRGSRQQLPHAVACVGASAWRRIALNEGAPTGKVQWGRRLRGIRFGAGLRPAAPLTASPRYHENTSRMLEWSSVQARTPSRSRGSRQRASVASIPRSSRVRATTIQVEMFW